MNEFAPVWNLPLWFDQYGNKDELDIMRQWIIDNEQKIIEENFAIVQQK